MQAYLPYFFPQAAQVFMQQLSQTALPLPTALPQQQRTNQIKKIQKIQRKLISLTVIQKSRLRKKQLTLSLATAPGNKTKTVVSNWLKNPQGVKKLEDVSDLTDIENVKTDEGFTANGDKLTWDTEGGDIYYKGYTDKALPVDVKVTYTLDGKEIKPEDLAGKSGKLTVRYDYTNNDKKTVKINGKKTDIYVPYLMATTAILDTNVYSNVEVTNGKLISDGSRQILIGVAMPGLTKSLDLQDNEDIEIPEYVEFTADVKDFE